MKKVITLALAAMVVVLGLASCNKKDGDNTQRFQFQIGTGF